MAKRYRTARYPDARGITTSTRPVIVLWLRRDLRLADNPALLAAADLARERDARLLPVYVWTPSQGRPWTPGDAARSWLQRSLLDLDAALQARGSRLLQVTGDPPQALSELADTLGSAGAVVWAEGLGPEERGDDRRVSSALRDDRVETLITPQANLLCRPGGLRTLEGRPYKVFTPFWRAALASAEPAVPLAPPLRLPAAPDAPAGKPATAMGSEAAPAWSTGFDAVWRPGEGGAQERLGAFLGGPLWDYATMRDRPDLEASSRLSPHLHWGELTARQVWHGVSGALAERGLDLEAAVNPRPRDEEQAPGPQGSAGAFLRQVGWREFAHHLLAAYPHTPERPLHDRFAAFPWRDDPAGLLAWQRGHTGYPIVDAAMRQLRATGWMHNRARLLAASFLVKDLLLSWRLGADWFWDTLVDADLANNTLGWQWVAGSGADAAPYFRVFNPVTQARRFDPDGAYVRRWVPELSGLDAPTIHAPWLASATTLARAGVALGDTYPEPIVDHGEARLRALAAYDAVRHLSR